jgi:hypothetical protein
MIVQCSKCTHEDEKENMIILNEGEENEIIFCDYCAMEDLFETYN